MARGAGELYPESAICPAAEREEAQTLASELLFVEVHKALRDKQAADSGVYRSVWWKRCLTWLSGKERSRQEDGDAITSEGRMW